MNNLDKILEGLLFLSGDGLDKGTIMEKLQITPKELDKAVNILKERYNEDCGINFITYKDKLQLCASPKYAEDVSLVLNPIRERQLSKATLEVMAIIAYKQPITRLDIQDIRGVNSDYAIQTLLNYKLIECVGRKDAVGKPLLFGTTDEFLRHFGINDLSDLPDYEELMKSIEQIQMENNHLYNEFEIPEDESAEEKTDSNLQARDKNKTLEEILNGQTENSAESNKQPAKENADELLENLAENLSENQTLEELYNNDHNANSGLENLAKDTTLGELNGEENTENTGIDYSVLLDNPDIEQ